MNMNTLVARAAIYCMAAANKAKNAVHDFVSSEDGMTVIEIVLLIAIAVVAVGALSAYMMGSLKNVFENLNSFISGASGTTITQKQ